MNGAAARALTANFMFIVIYLRPLTTMSIQLFIHFPEKSISIQLGTSILNTYKEMMTNQLQIHRVKLKDSNAIVIYYYKSINQTNIIHSLNVQQQFGQQVKKHYGLFPL